MRITKTYVQALRSVAQCIIAEHEKQQSEAPRIISIDIDPRFFLALLDERQALRDALNWTLPIGPDGETVVDEALSRGENE